MPCRLISMAIDRLMHSLNSSIGVERCLFLNYGSSQLAMALHNIGHPIIMKVDPGKRMSCPYN